MMNPLAVINEQQVADSVQGAREPVVVDPQHARVSEGYGFNYVDTVRHHAYGRGSESDQSGHAATGVR